MIQTINISLIPSDNKPVINVSQYDNVSRVLRFNVFDDVEMTVPHVFDLGDTTLLNIRKNDNNIVVITGVIVSDIDSDTQEITEQYLTFELTEQACACVGSNYGEVSITSGDDEVIGTCNFKLIVERSPLAGGITSQTEIDNLTTQIEEIAEQVIGDDYYNKEEINGMFDDLDIPTKTSELTNDSGFITAEDIPAIPTKTSELENDSGFITAEDIPTIPTKTSELTNDSGFTTIDDAATVSDKTWSSEKIYDELYALLPVGTASGTVASFNTALAKPLVSCLVDENATKLVHTNNDASINEYFRGLFLGTHAFANLSDLAYSFVSQDRWESLSIRENVLRPSAGNVKANIICNTFDTYSTYEIYSDLTLNGIAVAQNGIMYVRNGSNTDTPTGYIIYELTTPVTPTITSEQFATLCTAFGINGEIINLPFAEMPITYVGDNNFFTDYGDITVHYKDTVNNYIDTRINAVSSRSLSMMRTLETLEKSTTLERGETDDQK